MTCPKCGYLMSELDTQCQRCANLGELARPEAKQTRQGREVFSWPLSGLCCLPVLIVLVTVIALLANDPRPVDVTPAWVQGDTPPPVPAASVPTAATPISLSPSSDGYAWQRATEAARVDVCRTLAYRIGTSHTSDYYYGYLTEFYQTSDPAVLRTQTAEIAAMASAGF